ncbi:hypothetical protein F5888DRAFT_1705353 [Russula emetica]|nr:hypothetical protein F5888DRAFT_1740567 [Russula emetica]KAF8496111.1 hypothetical protein F5888DRAFT_1705353 [Russula emetica]
MLEDGTIAAGNRFGNIFVNRLDIKVSDQVDDDPTGAGILHIKGLFMGMPHKTQLVAHFHIDDLITEHSQFLDSGQWPGGAALLHGTVDVLVPFASKEEVDLISTLEQQFRRMEQTNL